MRTYFKILLISIFTIVAFVGLSHIVEMALVATKRSSILPTIIWLIGLIVALTLGIILPLKWCTSTKAKIITILLLPTNYGFAVILFFAYKVCKTILDILFNFSHHFG